MDQMYKFKFEIFYMHNLTEKCFFNLKWKFFLQWKNICHSLSPIKKTQHTKNKGCYFHKTSTDISIYIYIYIYECVCVLKLSSMAYNVIHYKCSS